jgi:lipopolysaccharide/colanic/teichoic acid biosynthesis glycosyltransferase
MSLYSGPNPHSDPALTNPYLRYKGALSLLVAAPLCLGLAPLIFVVWLLVKITSPGPGFYSQVRLGRGGRRFTIYKLRTMRVNAEAGTGPVWATENDPRITPIGRFLRKYHLDELPQIFNVLQGDMCFVGPRPERPEIAEKLVEKIPNYYDRLAIHPGITGMAQLHLPADSDLASVCAKLGYETAYIKAASAWLDARIFAATIFKTIPGMSGLAVRFSYSAVFMAEANLLAERQTETALGLDRLLRRRYVRVSIG